MRFVQDQADVSSHKTGLYPLAQVHCFGAHVLAHAQSLSNRQEERMIIVPARHLQISEAAGIFFSHGAGLERLACSAPPIDYGQPTPLAWEVRRTPGKVHRRAHLATVACYK